MGRPPKLEIVKELSGAYKKNPQRRRGKTAHTPTPGGLGPPPQDWVEKAKHNQRYVELLRSWGEIVAQDLLRVLNPSHRMLVESTCYLIYKIRLANAGLAKSTSGDAAQLKSNLAAMGQTPIDSPRLADAVRVPERPAARGSGGASGWGEYAS